MIDALTSVLSASREAWTQTLVGVDQSGVQSGVFHRPLGELTQGSRLELGCDAATGRGGGPAALRIFATQSLFCDPLTY